MRVERDGARAGEAGEPMHAEAAGREAQGRGAAAGRAAAVEPRGRRGEPRGASSGMGGTPGRCAR